MSADRDRAFRLAAAALVLLLTLPATPPRLSAQTPTRVTVRAVAHDAKIIGSGVGGARISVYDAETGERLARGVQEGGTGDTGKLMVEPRERGESVHDTDGAASYTAELDLDRPTRVRIVAEGPLGTPHATQEASRTMLLVPGEDVTGEGVVLELYGFTVELLEPAAPGAGAVGGGEMPVRARVTMLCGCPTEPGGLWDSKRYEIRARLVRDDGSVARSAPLAFAGETSVYEGELRVPAEVEGLTLQVLAMDAERANFGMVERRLDRAEGEEGARPR